MSKDYWRGMLGLPPEDGHKSARYMQGLSEAQAGGTQTEDSSRSARSHSGALSSAEIAGGAPQALFRLYEAWDSDCDEGFEYVGRPFIGLFVLMGMIFVGLLGLGLFLGLRALHLAFFFIVSAVAIFIVMIPLDIVIVRWIGAIWLENYFINGEIILWLAVLATLVMAFLTDQLVILLVGLCSLLYVNLLILLVASIWAAIAFATFGIGVLLSSFSLELVGLEFSGDTRGLFVLGWLTVAFFVAGRLTSKTVTKYGMNFL